MKYQTKIGAIICIPYGLLFSYRNAKNRKINLALRHYFCIFAAKFAALLLIFAIRRRKDTNMAKEDNMIQVPIEEVKLAFAARCVEGAARKLGVPYIEVYNRMRKVDLIPKYILPHYDMLHTESLEYLIEDVIECLTNWEKKGKAIAQYLRIRQGCDSCRSKKQDIRSIRQGVARLYCGKPTRQESRQGFRLCGRRYRQRLSDRHCQSIHDRLLLCRACTSAVSFP